MDNNRQKKIEHTNQSLMLSFKTTTQLHDNLKLPRVSHYQGTIQENKIKIAGKTYVQMAKEELLNNLNKKESFSIESEIIQLENVLKVNREPNTEQMIRRQKESRRERHIKILNDFEKKEEVLFMTLDAKFQGIDNEVKKYFEESDKEINSYFDSLDDTVLISREMDFIQDLDQITNGHKVKRQDRISTLDNRLKEIERERTKNLKFLCERLEADMFEVSFILLPEIQSIRQKKWEEFEKNITDNSQKNQEFLQNIDQLQASTFEDFELKKLQKISQWRLVKHNQAVDLFIKKMMDIEIVNPQERVKMFTSLEKFHLKSFNNKQVFLKKLNDYEISHLSQKFVEKWKEESQKLNEKSQEFFDNIFDKLMKQHSLHNQMLESELEFTISELKRFNAELNMTLDEFIIKELKPYVTNLQNTAKDLLADTIKFVEDSDFKSNEIVTNFGNYYLDLAKKLDEFKKTLTQMDQSYELVKAQAADKNDEILDLKNEELEALKEQLKRSIHHPQLQEFLEKSFEKLDEIEEEFRAFHDKNIEIEKTHMPLIQKTFFDFEKNIAENFQMYDESRRKELQDRNKQIIENRVKLMIEEEEKRKLAEEEKINEEIKAKGGKAPAPKKVDPKKAQAEYDARYQELLSQQKIPNIEEYVSNTNNKYILVQSIEDIARKMYPVEEESVKQASVENAEAQLNQNNVDNSPKSVKKEEILPIDFKQIPPKDPQGKQVLNENVVIEINYLIDLLLNFRTKLNTFVNMQYEDKQGLEQQNDKEFIEESILILDERLKQHYPLKGKIEVELFQQRTSQITDHKMRYERHTRSVLEKNNYHTEQFNHYLEDLLIGVKKYEKDQNQNRSNLLEAESLSRLQGIMSSTKENFFKFTEKMNDSELKLKNLAETEIKNLLHQNREFIKGFRTFEKNGNYSETEISWYNDMILKIDEQIQEQQVQRSQKLEEILKFCLDRKQLQMTNFEKEYVITQEEIAAKDGTGKKYGRPRRLAQERLATEMNKCNEAQDSINKCLEEINKEYELYKANVNNRQYFNNQESISLRIRSILMTLRTNMGRYAAHISALLPNNKVQEMVRVNYDEFKFEITLTPEQVEQDKKKLDLEQEAIGQLYYQTDAKQIFNNWIVEIDKNVRDEAQKLYTGNNAKWLTGADKIPDYLRIYLENMKQSCEAFRIQCCRLLRNSVMQLSELSEKISETIIMSIQYKYSLNIDYQLQLINQEFKGLIQQSEILKKNHSRIMRPNLSHPSCKNELDGLLAKEKQRLEETQQQINLFWDKSKELEFNSSNDFFKALLNNFEFLLTFYDACILYEDFITLPGDDAVIKKHENLKNIMRRKQEGILVDTSSERSITKSWPGLLIHSFKVDSREITYTAQNNTAVDSKDPKAKKDPKKKDAPVEQVVASVNETKPIKSIKNFRQKSANYNKEQAFNLFKTRFDQSIQDINKQYQTLLKNEKNFEQEWQKTLISIFED